MKYSLVEIRPCWFEGKWVASSDTTDTADREPARKYAPDSNLGFFYFPRRWGVQKGFKMLKEAMIKRRKEHIEQIQKDIEDIEKLEL